MMDCCYSYNGTAELPFELAMLADYCNTLPYQEWPEMRAHLVVKFNAGRSFTYI